MTIIKPEGFLFHTPNPKFIKDVSFLALSPAYIPDICGTVT